jgi:ribosomal subunit interface protein
MEITINARQGRLPDSVRNQAVQRFSRLERLDRRISTGTLVIDAISNGHRAEARLLAAGGPPLVGHAEAGTLRGAIDGALERLERQVKRRRERRLARRSRARVPIPRDVVLP